MAALNAGSPRRWRVKGGRAGRLAGRPWRSEGEERQARGEPYSRAWDFVGAGRARVSLSLVSLRPRVYAVPLPIAPLQNPPRSPPESGERGARSRSHLAESTAAGRAVPRRARLRENREGKAPIVGTRRRPRSDERRSQSRARRRRGDVAFSRGDSRPRQRLACLHFRTLISSSQFGGGGGDYYEVYVADGTPATWDRIRPRPTSGVNLSGIVGTCCVYIGVYVYISVTVLLFRSAWCLFCGDAGREGPFRDYTTRSRRVTRGSPRLCARRRILHFECPTRPILRVGFHPIGGISEPSSHWLSNSSQSRLLFFHLRVDRWSISRRVDIGNPPRLICIGR